MKSPLDPGRRSLHHYSFRSKKNQRTVDKLTAQSFFAHARMERPVHELSSCQKRKSSREMESERTRILLERQKEQILSEVRTEIQKHEFQADSER